jgi:hypothetical protein
VNCPLIEIQVAPGSLHFKIEGDLLVTSDGTEIVRYFGLDREIVIGAKVKVMGKSCFERCKHIDQIDFEPGSELDRIGPAALRDCRSLSSIEIPTSVRIVEESSFEGCTELESCFLNEDSSLVAIGATAFAKCASLRSFDIPGQVGEIGSNCFTKCNYLYRLRFHSSESLKKVIGDRSLDDALGQCGVSADSSLFRIEVDDGGVELQIPGWVSAQDDDDDSLWMLVRDLQ